MRKDTESVRLQPLLFSWDHGFQSPLPRSSE